LLFFNSSFTPVDTIQISSEQKGKTGAAISVRYLLVEIAIACVLKVQVIAKHYVNLHVVVDALLELLA
jgi:hypothetical protein